MDLTARSGVNLTSPVRGRVSRTGRCNRLGPHGTLWCELNITGAVTDMDLTARSGVNLTSPVRGRVSHIGCCNRHGAHGALWCEPNITSERTCVTHWGAVTDMDLTARSGVNLPSPVRGRVSHIGCCNRHGPHGALRCEPNITSERTCVTHWVL
ncbi:hypothetical protein RRG08_040922 [Elysia crispata]|uniref:Uncharacterized protein n=1 Tax=Elysia crispata TaxID=231223 RepID=A0AAE0ZEP7_9GAST|nr:hypothetical protein RRG08_040922 [Elysia crispata]